ERLTGQRPPKHRIELGARHKIARGAETTQPRVVPVLGVVQRSLHHLRKGQRPAPNNLLAQQPLDGRHTGSAATTLAISSPASVGFSAAGALALRSASILAWAVPGEPEMMAPAWPIFLPGGAVTPAMYAPPGLVIFEPMNSAAFSSSEPPISPI